MKTRGTITEIQRFSLHDGPGIRTTVFLKGCPLHCSWCHNPETISRRAEILWHRERCLKCGACGKACPRHIDRTAEGAEGCEACGQCVEYCPGGALQLAGRQVTTGEVIEEVMEDRIFYGSEGGVTLSGGEPLVQDRFAKEILKGCKDEGIHTAIETSLAYPWERLGKLLPEVDMVMFDLKIWDDAKHRHHTGCSNKSILSNIRRLGESGKALIARTPVIRNVNDSVEEIAAMARFLSDLPHLEYYELLPYHALGSEKYPALNREAPVFEPPEESRLHELSAAILKNPITLKIAGESHEHVPSR